MSMNRVAFVASMAAALVVASCSKQPEPAPVATPKPTALVDAARLTAPADGEWLSYGRTYDEQRFSPLDKIDAGNVGQLGLAWSYDLDTAHRVQESTPLVIDGVMYVTSAWSKLFALEAKSGKEIWRFDPKVPGEAGVKACCDVGNRGVAAWNGKIFLGTLDGRLIALDAATGKQLWEVMTVPAGQNYTITGAPRVFEGKVLIGNGGAELGARGFVTAYDADSGKQVWRFYTVPGDPSQPFESPALEKAAKTWKGQWWKFGGGGTVWDSIVYDPKLRLIYIGVGNGSPWNQALRSPGGGDNLYLSSIVALKVDNGEYVWHFQTTPGETWDYTATQPIILADLEIGGKPRQVLMQAPKNGYFYVIDRVTGEFISGAPYAFMNWSKGLDPKTGRPIENREARYDKSGKPAVVVPGPGGAHNWHPMSFSPLTRLAYFPVIEAGFAFIPVDEDEGQHDWLEYRHRSQRRQPAQRPQGARRHQAAAQGTPGRVGSGGAEGSLARAVRTSVEWRNARDRGQSRVSWQRDGRVRGLSRDRWTETLVGADAGGCDGGADDATRSMASSTWPSKWVGAAPSAWPRANWRAMRTWRRTFRACWCSRSAAKRSSPSFRRPAGSRGAAAGNR